ncbi:MAG TPA: SPOR domain-containing protein [Gemmatimonadales bacterium]|nr:SPOR domain-containing protein [Gemmatimonadales bacterium]
MALPRASAASVALFLTLVGGPGALAAQSDPRLVNALRIAQEGATDSARSIVNGLLQQTTPTDTLYPQILYTMGLVSRSVEEMRRNYTRVAVEYANSSWADNALFRLALLDYAAGNFDGVVRELNRVRSDYPDSPLIAPASEWAARSLFDLKRSPEACAWLAAGIERAGTDVELKNRLDYLNGRCTASPPVAPESTAAQPPSPTAPAPPPPPARTGFGVQIGAVNSQTGADKLSQDLKSAGFEPYVVQEDGLFKVRAGPYADRTKALAAAAQMRKKLGRTPFVVKEP